MAALREEGKIRIVFTDAHQTVKTEMFKARTDDMQELNDPRQMPIVPLSELAVGEDSLVILEMKADNADTVVPGSSYIRIPITRLNTRTGIETPDTLIGNKDLFTSNVTTVAGSWVTLGTYTIPAQEKIKLGKRIVENSRILLVPYDDTA